MHGRRHSPGLHCLHKLCTLQVLLTCVERFLFTLFFFSLVLAVGVIGNVLVLIVILTSKSMRSSTNLFLLNLSIADLLVLIVCCPNAMVEMYMRRVRRNCLSEIIVYSSFAGHLGDGQDHVPACPLHRAHRVCVSVTKWPAGWLAEPELDMRRVTFGGKSDFLVLPAGGSGRVAGN